MLVTPSIAVRRGIFLLFSVALTVVLTSCTSPSGQPPSSGCPRSVAGGGSLIDWVNFVRLNGIQYVAPPSISSSLQPNQLGPVVATVHCRMEGSVLDPGYRPKDGDAGFLNPGTPLYAVKAYKPSFRLAAWQDGRLTLFEADSTPAARVGGDLLDISEKVQYIGVNSEQDGVTELAAIRNAADVNALVGAVLQAPVNQQLTDHSGARYFVAFHLEDGTAVVRAYWPATGELSRGIVLPQQFRQAIEQALRH
jgi:hypothetical protein